MRNLTSFIVSTWLACASLISPVEADTFFPAINPLSTSAAPVVSFLGDSITARASYFLSQVTVGGTAHTGDVLTFVATASTLPGSPITVTYTMTGGDTLITGASNLAAAINANANLIAAGITAGASSATFTVQQSAAPTLTANFPKATFAVSVTGSGVTTTLTLNLNIQANNSIGFAYWARVLSNYRGWSPLTNNFGVSGYTTTQMLSVFPQLLASAPNIMVLMGGRNDCQFGGTPGPDTTLGTVENNLKTMYDGAQNSNIIVIAVKILSQTYSEWPSAAAEQCALTVNNWIEQQKEFRKGFYVVDAGSVYDDPTSTSHWQPRTNYVDSSDNTHPTIWGAYAIGNLIAATINQIWPNWRLPIMNVDDVYNATSNYYGNLLPDQMFTGTGGSFSGGGSTSGSVATGWVVETAGLVGVAVAASKTTWPTTGQAGGGQGAQTLTISGLATGSGDVGIQTSITTSNLNVGDTLECSVMVNWGATTNIASVSASLADNENSTVYDLYDGYSTILTPEAGYSLPTDSTNANAPASITEQLITPRRTLAYVPSSIQFLVLVHFDTGLSSGTVAGAFQLASPSCRKVQSATQ